MAAPANGITGRYSDGETAVYLATCHDSLAMKPAHWTSIEYLTRVRGDSFAVAGRSHRTVVLVHDGAGDVASIRSTGFGIPDALSRAAPGTQTSLELLLAGDVAGAYRLARVASDSGRRAIAVADQVARFPTKRRFAAELARRVSARYEGSRAPAAAPASDSGWRVPFALAALFAPPAPGELARVARSVASRDRLPRNVRVLFATPVHVGHDEFVLTIIAYTLGSTELVGGLVVPARPSPRCCAVLLDIKGTNPSYSPLNLTRGSAILPLLGTAASAYIVAIPAIRGERLIVGSREFASEGDRTDGWDGGADDAIALVTAARMIEPRADTTRLCAFGRSRGGTVALLVAARDRRVRCAVAVSPPTDWFDAMWWDGPPKEELLRRALASRARPEEEGGQFIERILAPAIGGRWSLADSRDAMIASSPLYVADRLPPVLAFFGEEDRQVPVQNGRVLASALAARAPAARRSFRVVITPWAGHDADPLLIVREVPGFLARHLGTPRGTRLPGADGR